MRKPAQDFFLFLVGGSLFAAGIFLFTNQVMVSSGYGFGLGFGIHPARGWGRAGGSFLGGLFTFGDGQGFGLLMLPFGVGVALLLADVYRKLGWFLVWASSAALGVAVLQSLLFIFRPASLWSLLSMIFMIGAGAGLMFKSLRDYQQEERGRLEREVEDSRQNVHELRKELNRLKARIRNEPES